MPIISDHAQTTLALNGSTVCLVRPYIVLARRIVLSLLLSPLPCPTTTTIPIKVDPPAPHITIRSPASRPGCVVVCCQWESFWRTSLPHFLRTVLFRFLPGKLTSRSILHRIVPTLVTSPKSSICRYHDESSVHLLFACPLKMQHFAPPVDSIQNVISSFASWSWPLLRPVTPSLSAPLVFDTILAVIWSAHWHHVYDDIPFSAPNVLTSVNMSIQLLRDESCLFYPATL
ncbi:hypothetical protein DM01DRAFT_322962 [Hesseltinella vesiculosa]|uniref:Reverse transcriptase zinc-binding domain-containing protein n=1 Tax=Hesseltinella vesiculosa TaxID=101127 RepID=A0A1X2GXQ4_9FUNG|nr:hypothetical protein DM01DRAFT_322962 [Hesseltinella vesiculosa]